MGTTVIVIDTNVFYRYPLLHAGAWSELISKAGEWDLHFAIPAVVEQEAANVVRRKWRKVRRAVAGQTLVTEMGLAEQHQSLVDRLDEKIADYPTRLADRLHEISAEVVPIPESVDLMEVAQRAIDERAPYSSGTKDGFRDTLIWHTVCEIARRDLECEVWFVSDNYSDFGASDIDSEECPHPIHPDLAEELGAGGLSERVSYVRSLDRLKQHLAGRYDPLPAEQREALVALIDREAFNTKLQHDFGLHPIGPNAAALPLRTRQASIVSFERDSADFELIDAAWRGAGAWTAQFKTTINATIAALEFGDDGPKMIKLTKPLLVRGRIEVDSRGDLKRLVARSVQALPDDPMREVWHMRNQLAHGRGFLPPDTVQSMLKSYREALKGIDPSVFDSALGSYREALKGIDPSAFKSDLESYREGVESEEHGASDDASDGDGELPPSAGGADNGSQ